MFGGVFEKGSLAEERNSFTFLSDLVQTSLACSLLRVPHLKSVRTTTKKRHRQGEKHAKSPGLERFVENLLTLASRGPRLGLRKESLPLCGILSATCGRLVIFFCFLS